MSITKMSLKDLDVANKKVLVRVDFNVPLNDSQEITDDTRIRAALPTIKYIIDNGGIAIVMSHLGRPKGEKNVKFSLAPCAKRLSELIGKDVIMAPDSIGDEVKKITEKMKAGGLLLLENLRFYKAESKPDSDPSFAQSLASLGDLYVNDAFGTAHRKHSSTATISAHFPGKAAAGFLLEKEIRIIGNLLSEPKKPFYAIIGGAKISSKIGVINSLLNVVDGIIIGGGMAYTFMKAQGIPIGDSIHEDEHIETALSIIEKCKTKKIDLVLPVDVVISDEYSNDAERKVASIEDGIPNGYQGMSIGPETLELSITAINKAKTIIWNGPLGVYEMSKFAVETVQIAKALASCDGQTIVGGGDCVAAVKSAGIADKMYHISTGGGATLEFIEFGTLPGIEALSDI